MGKTICINGTYVPVIDDEVSGGDIKSLAGIPPERVLVMQEQDRNVIIPDSRVLRVAGNETFTHHANHSKAGPRTAGDR